jgi:hypothetical protein
MELNKPKSRRELYNEKLKEREIYSNNFLDRFTENGAGAPLRNNDGTIITKRRTMMNNDYEDIMLSQRNVTPNPINYNRTQQMNLLYQPNDNINNANNSNIVNNDNDLNYMNNNNFKTLQNRNININNLYNNNDYIINNNNENQLSNQNQDENIINNDFQMTNFHRRPQSQANFSNTLNQYANRTYNNISNNIEQENNIRNDPYGNNYQGTGIIPRDRTSEVDRRYQNQVLRETWLKEIEEKKLRDAQRKQEQKELDLKYEEKYRREIAEENEIERNQKLKAKENEENMRNINYNLIENKKNNQINDDNNNNNFQENMVMNGNNLEPLQSSSPSFEEFNAIPPSYDQNSSILRQQPNNTDLNNYINNNDQIQVNEYGFGLDSNPREIEDNINEQIAKLRNDVNSQYIEMSNLFGKLKMDVIEANQLKNEAEKELQYIKKELAKNKMASLAYDAQLNQVLERHAPYNNMHINIKDVDPLYSLRNARKDLQSTSNMIYATDMVNEQNVNRVKQLSALAQAGQNLVGLKAESEFIPINSPGENNEFNNEGNNFGNELNSDPKNNIAISKTGYKNLESDSYPIFQPNNDGGFANKDEPKILDEYMRKGDYSNMYKQLADIANINHNMGGENKLKTLSKNYEIDYKAFNEKHLEQQKKNINPLDQLINELN